MITELLVALALSLGIQAVFFALAAGFRTDKVTDLSYGLTFIVTVLVLLVRHDTPDAPQLVLAAMVVVWGLRLAGYLVYRILHMGRDPRFDGIREHFTKFLQFWTFQGVFVWIVLLPTILWFGVSPSPSGWTWAMTAGALTWLAGLVIETLADAQKFRVKRRAGSGARWMDSGLWQYSRHPNYFGEMLCWWGLYLFVLPDLGWWALPGLVGPVSLTWILLRVTGIPTLEASARRKWGRDPGYQAYLRRTSRLIPRPPRR